MTNNLYLKKICDVSLSINEINKYVYIIEIFYIYLCPIFKLYLPIDHL